MSEPLTLAPESVEAIAARVAELIGPAGATANLIDAAEVARRFNVSRDYIYEHAEALGAIRLGSGPKARLRFDLERVAEALSPQPFKTPTDQPTRRRHRTVRAVELLPVKPTRSKGQTR